MRGAFFVTDVACQNYPVQYHFSSEIRSGRFPVWTPQLFCGFPLYAEGQGGLFYPPNLLFHIRPASIGLNLYVILHFFLAGAFLYWFARTIGLSSWGALLAGLAYSFSALIDRHHGILNHFGSLVWLPVPLAILNCWIKSRKNVWPLLGGLALGFQWLAGHPQYSWMTHLALGLLLACHCFGPSLPGARDKLKALGVVAVMVVVGLGLSMVQLLPMLELARFSGRAGGAAYEEILSSGIPTLAYAGLLSPRFFGMDGNGTGLGDLDEVATLYVGVATLVLIPFAFRQGHRTVSVILGLFAALAVLLCLENAAWISQIIAAFPPASLFRYRSRYMVYFVLAAVLLAGRGLDALLGEKRERADSGFLGFQSTCWVVGLLLAGVVATWSVHRVREGWFEKTQHGPTVADQALVGKKLEVLREARSEDLWRSIALWSIAVAVTGLYLTRFLRPGQFAVVVIAHLSVNGLFFGAESPPLIDRRFYAEQPETLKLVRGQDQPFRVYALWEYPINPYDGDGIRTLTTDPRESYPYYASLLATDMSLLYGVDNADGFPHSLRLSRFLKLRRQVNASGDVRLLSVMNVKYVFSILPINVSGLTPIYEGKVRAYLNERCLPRAFVVHSALRASDEAGALAMMLDRSWDPAKTAIIEREEGDLGRLGGRGDAGQGSAHIEVYEPTHVEIEVKTPQAGLLVLSDANYPGWEARVDGRKARIYQTDYLFRGVMVERGTHRVSFDYRPVAFRRGLLISSATALLLLVVGFSTVFRRGRHRRRRTA
jgi:hypothetical protein